MEHYDNIFTIIENDNKAMLKMAAKVGFKIIGCRYFSGAVLLEHLIDLREG